MHGCGFNFQYVKKQKPLIVFCSSLHVRPEFDFRYNTEPPLSLSFSLSLLLSRLSTTWATPPALFLCWVFSRQGVLNYLAGLALYYIWSLPPESLGSQAWATSTWLSASLCTLLGQCSPCPRRSLQDLHRSAHYQVTAGCLRQFCLPGARL
jgi:hypothetical protein